MTINKTNIKNLLGITATTYDNQIDLLIPQILDSISEYCKNDFLLYNNNSCEFVYEDCDMVITSTTITLTTTLSIETGDFIRLYNSKYNDGLYQVKTIANGVITIETSKSLRAETTESITIAIVDFPSSFINIISDYVKNNIVRDGTVKMEEIDDVRVDYFETYNNNEFLSKNNMFLSPYKKVYKDNYFEV